MEKKATGNNTKSEHFWKKIVFQNFGPFYFPFSPRVMVLLFFLFLLSLKFNVVSNQLFSAPSVPCFEYELQNECSSLLSDVRENRTIQEILFEAIDLDVSDIRMIPSSCRRPLLWYLCGSVFLSCPPETEEEIFCRQVEGCIQVSERCEDYNLSLGCPFSPYEKESPCSQRILEEIEEMTENPIEVETCLGEERQTIECCPNPFVFDSEGECVIECLQYEFGEQFERSVRIACFVFIWVGILVFFLGIFPFVKMSFNFRFVFNYSKTPKKRRMKKKN